MCNKKSFKLCFLALLSLSTINACAPLPVKDVFANKERHLADNFTTQQLSTNVQEKLASSYSTSGTFKTIKISFNVVFEYYDTKDQTPTVVVKYNNLGNGIIQKTLEYANNGIPYGMQYNLDFMGIMPLRSQNVDYIKKAPSLIIETKKVAQLTNNLLQTGENAEHIFEWSSKYNNFKLVCRTDKFFMASTLHPSLAGKAIDLKCDKYNDNTLIAKQKYTLLQQYGFALYMEHIGSKDKESYAITNVEIF